MSRVEDFRREFMRISQNKVDDDIVQYLCSIIESDPEIAPEDFGAIGAPFLVEADVVPSEEEAMALCDEVFAALEPVATRVSKSVLLAAPVNVAQMSGDGSTGLDWLKQKEDQTLVDVDKLEALEAKQRERLEKRERRELARKARQLEKAGVGAQSLSGTTLQRATDASGCRDVRVENFGLAYGRLQLINASMLKLSYGHRYGLVGRNGSGKSTLMRHIASREIPIPSNLSLLHVEQEVMGDDTTAVEAVLSADSELMELRREEEHLHSIQGSTDRLKALYDRMEAIDAHSAESRARSILSGLSFTQEMQDKATKEFSGGWRMRIALARALFCRPDILLLDEPTNHLDFHAVIWLERFLQSWPATLLIVSHQREFLNGVATDIIHLYNKDLTYYKGNYDAFEKVASEKIRMMQKAFDAQQMQRAHIQKFIDKFRYNAKRASMAQSRIKTLEKMTVISPIVEEDAVYLPFTDPEQLSPPILQFIDVSFGYPDQPSLFSDVNIGIDLESRVALVGPNGCGKSTLLKIFSGELQPSRGEVVRNSKLRFATFSQHFVDQLDMNVSPLEYFHSLYPSLPNQDIRTHLGKYGITGDIALRSMAMLSGGQKSRVVFARMAMSTPHILLLDEPSNHLDIETIEGLAQSLSVFQGGLLLISHDQRLISLVCDEIWQVQDGTVQRWNGTLEEYKRHMDALALR